ncbi:rhodanese-like domain-containing protein [Mycoplasma leachii]|uniref:rhodanese-like domain-containing protein n=1 Tax=Mycoplasma leachii TaxID=2105 RepID=UPI003DA6A324
MLLRVLSNTVWIHLVLFIVPRVFKSCFLSSYNEIPKYRPVYIHCRTSRSSYKSIKMLEKLGFNNLINIQGSFLQLSYYEYFNDKTTNRKKILTDYNFE